MDTNMRKAISPTEKLAVTLRYLTSGCTFQDLHYSFKLGASTIGNIVREVCNVVWEELAHIQMPSMTEEMWKDTAAKFKQRANFPHCLGAINGKHIRVIKPTGTGSQHFNYKHYFSIALLAIVDSNYKFVYVDIGSFEKDSDSTIFKNSTFWNLLQKNKLNIPESCPILNTDIIVDYVFVGDEAFGISQHVLRPYGGRNLTKNKRIFNYRLSRARRYVECAFGILSNKWRIFHRPMNVTTELAVDITKACCVLHNYVREKNGINFQDTLSIDGFEDVNTTYADRGTRSASDMRNTFADYFSTVGAVPWQNDK
ncbi:protein ALP1-like [Rhopalosiphum maidis]|uniref:protein ALP1-like n=1 Tax=Rhopalosiphum maidis TaxID=43146 RepID=UPI000EFE4A46|nr:protein ALP1-like [Rhopalosiphum maidis]